MHIELKQITNGSSVLTYNRLLGIVATLCRQIGYLVRLEIVKLQLTIALHNASQGSSTSTISCLGNGERDVIVQILLKDISLLSSACLCLAHNLLIVHIYCVSFVL